VVTPAVSPLAQATYKSLGWACAHEEVVSLGYDRFRIAYNMSRIVAMYRGKTKSRCHMDEWPVNKN
jgi:hypothetical protein